MRIQESHEEIVDFLKNTSPDAKSLSFFDRRADDDGRAYKDSVQKQRPINEKSIYDIATKHASDALDFEKDKEKVQALIASYQKGIKLLEPYIEILG